MEQTESVPAQEPTNDPATDPQQELKRIKKKIQDCQKKNGESCFESSASFMYSPSLRTKSMSSFCKGGIRLAGALRNRSLN